ncbi:hemin uptake protein HemP [Noviherbaspirillum sedimenti]|uniref:Hemin uptake protein HemP n=1 Tax=Noviherbaspirillum sedimenti TaxID=2320865 RepID=A0A3A3G184_9BURK|nr:hemin uptake protein HemP [Noviherbaspirillum sedimenti]RJG01671.1 hemin uptake protein HemP [Noviherbaspirillum sedimenti]
MHQPERNKAAAKNCETATSLPAPVKDTAKRIKSKDFFQQTKEVEIDHEGRISRLRLTQLNKLILTA